MYLVGSPAIPKLTFCLPRRSEEHATSFRDIAERFLTRPVKMLFLEPILLCMAFYISVVFGQS